MDSTMFACFAIFAAIMSCFTTFAIPITDPLPEEPTTPRSTSIQCPGGKPIHWTKTEPDKGDLSFSYTCGDSKAEKVIKLSCKKGYKPTYRKDLIPKRMIDAALSEISKRGSVVYGPEPNFGLFSSGAKFDVLDSASIVYVCMKGK